MTTFYEGYGVRRVINASGRMTALGVSTIQDEVGRALVAAAQNYVVIDELIDRVGELISTHTGAEDSCVTSSASAAICMSVAGIITKGELTLVERIPDTQGLRNEVVIQKGHAVHFGAPIPQMIRLGGGVPVEAGYATLVKKEHILGAITDKTAALMYVKSHHSVQEGMVSLPDMIELAHSHGLPILVDAAAEEDLRKYVAMGADLVCYSGAKAIEGPTSGFVTGRRELIAWTKAQYKGIGRPMKVGKDNMMGLVKALELYEKKDLTAYEARQEAIVEELLEGFQGIPHIRCEKSVDEAGRRIFRARVDVLPSCPLCAQEVADRLKAGSPAVYTRDHYLNVGSIYFDPRPMLPGDAEAVIAKMKAILAGTP